MTTASGQASPDNAGASDGLAKAFEAALESTDLGNAEFEAAAMQPTEKTEPVDSEPEQAAEAEPGATEEKAPPEAPAEIAAAPVTAPPAHWDAQRREAFGKLPAAGQKIVLDTVKSLEGEFTRKSTELADDKRFAQGIRSLISEQDRQQLRNSGMDEVAGISRLMELNRAFTQSPAGYLRWALQTTGLDPRQVFPEHFAGTGTTPAQQQAPNGAAQRQQPDPNTQQIYSALNPLFATVQGIQQELQQTKLTSATRVIANFKDAKDASGASLHPHLAAVERDMVEHLNSPALKRIEDYGERLQRAYDIAVANNGDLRSQSVEAEVQKRLAAAQDAERKKADLAKAKRAKAPVRSQPSGPVTVKPKGLDGAVRNAMDQAGV